MTQITAQRGSIEWYKQMHKALILTVQENRNIQMEMAVKLGAKEWIKERQQFQKWLWMYVGLLSIGAFSKYLENADQKFLSSMENIFGKKFVAEKKKELWLRTIGKRGLGRVWWGKKLMGK